MAHLNSPGIEHSDGIGIVRVEGFADKAYHFSAADGAGVVLNSDYVGDDEAEQVGVGGSSRKRLRVGG